MRTSLLGFCSPALSPSLSLSLSHQGLLLLFMHMQQVCLSVFLSFGVWLFFFLQWPIEEVKSRERKKKKLRNQGT